MAGAVRFDEYVDERLYGSRGFYETGGQAGRRGDFLTSPEVGPLFGALVSRAIDEWWDELGRPDPYVVVEAGAGRGALATSILRAVPRCRDALRYVTVERSASLRERQRELLGDSVEVRPDLPVVASVVLANELLDNLAFRVLERTSGGWTELWVEGSAPVLQPVREVPAPFAGLDCPVGTRLPWVETATAWVAGARRLAPVVVCIDYAVRSTAELVGRPWLRTYLRHGVGDDPFVAGASDITTDVPVDQLPAPQRLVRQAEWLGALGLDDLVREGRAAWTERAAVGDLAALEMRSREREAEALRDPGGLGGFLVMEWRA